MKTKHGINKHIEILGWSGVVLILASYALLSLGIISGDSYAYHLLVLAGSVFVAVISYRKRALQPAVLNIAFACLAVVAIGRIMFLL